VILFVRRCSDLCFFTPTNFSFVSNAGNRSFSFKWTCYPCCYRCCCKRPRHPWCPNCCSLSASTFSRSKNWDASHFLSFCFCSVKLILYPFVLGLCSPKWKNCKSLYWWMQHCPYLIKWYFKICLFVQIIFKGSSSCKVSNFTNLSTLFLKSILFFKERLDLIEHFGNLSIRFCHFS